ncbi:hypothetical protein H4R33_000914 [Dimargaris cristalligena]|nr:hypothetical protein H4R33_000914 [Dimargaris cristalligena]
MAPDSSVPSSSPLMTEGSPDPTSPDNRAKQACDFCRSRKIKCDRVRPMCSSCRPRNRNCVYTPTPAKQRRSHKDMPRSPVRLLAIKPCPPPCLPVVAPNLPMVPTTSAYAPPSPGSTEAQLASPPQLPRESEPFSSPLIAQACLSSPLPIQEWSQAFAAATDGTALSRRASPTVAPLSSPVLSRSPSLSAPIDVETEVALRDVLLERIDHLETLMRTMSPWYAADMASSDDVADNLRDFRGGDLLSSTRDIEKFFGIQPTSDERTPRAPLPTVAASSHLKAVENMVLDHTAVLEHIQAVLSPKVGELLSPSSSIPSSNPASLDHDPTTLASTDMDVDVDEVMGDPSSDDAAPANQLAPAERRPNRPTGTGRILPWTPARFQRYLEHSNSNVNDDPVLYLFAKLGHAFWTNELRISYESVFGAKKQPIPRSLYVPDDLLFHSNVLDHLLFLFCRIIYPVGPQLHFNRFMLRRAKGISSDAVQLAIPMVMAPISNHTVFQNVPPHLAGRVYYHHLRPMIPDLIESSDLDSGVIFMVLGEYEMGRGNTESSFSMISLAIRKFQSLRIHIMDHPHPAPKFDPHDGYPDMASLTDPLLRENYRNLWWGIFGQDVISSLLFGQLPSVDINNICINLPAHPIVFGQLCLGNLSDPRSPFYQDSAYPAFLTRPMSRYHTERTFVDLRVISHRVAQLRYYKASDPLMWFRERPHINQQLESWFLDCQDELNPQCRMSLLNVSPKIYREYLIFCLHVRITYFMTVIFLNYTGDMNPWPFTPAAPPSAPGESKPPSAGDSTRDHHPAPADGSFDPASLTKETGQADSDSNSSSNSNSSRTHEDHHNQQQQQPLTQLDPDGSIERDCQERCWKAVQELRRVIEQSMSVPNFFQNTLFLGAFYAAAVVCIETIQRSDDRERIEWAQQFVEEIISFLSQFGQLWVTNLKAVQTIKQLRESSADSSKPLTLAFN